jgi:hypothetical protein
MKTTRYFEEQVLRKRPYIQLAWIAPILAAPIRRVTQPDGRIRSWGAVVDPRDGQTRYFRVVTLDDGETVHNAFFDRDFEDKSP